MSSNNGSPNEPGSLVLSKTEILFTVFGKTSKKYLAEKGLYRWTEIKPTFSPVLLSDL